MNSISNLTNEELIEYYHLNSKRLQNVKSTGFDTKFAANLIRLLYECEQLLTTGGIDLQRDREHLKAIRRGDVSQEEIERWAAEKEFQLEKMYATSTYLAPSCTLTSPHLPSNPKSENNPILSSLKPSSIHFASLNNFL